MPTETVTLHPTGLSLTTSAQAWYPRDKKQWKWHEIRAEVRNLQRKVPGFKAGGRRNCSPPIAGRPRMGARASWTNWLQACRGAWSNARPMGTAVAASEAPARRRRPGQCVHVHVAPALGAVTVQSLAPTSGKCDQDR